MEAKRIWALAQVQLLVSKIAFLTLNSINGRVASGPSRAVW
jgi:hypothetical protein